VAGEDGNTSATYTLAVFRGSDIATDSSEARLSGLTLASAELDQSFQSDRTVYTASVDFAQASITLTPVVADTGIAISVNGDELDPGSASATIALAKGQNLIHILVATADGSATATYTLSVLRGSETTVAEGSPPRLLSFSVSGITLDQPFDSERLAYSASTGFYRTTTTLTPVAVEAGATILINGIEVASESPSATIILAVGQNLIEIEVTTADSNATTTYTVAVYRSDGTTASADASLSGLTLNGATLDQLFQASQTAYSASVNFLQASVTLTPVANHAGATICVGQPCQIPGETLHREPTTACQAESSSVRNGFGHLCGEEP
jgi:hypothetical protein